MKILIIRDLVETCAGCPTMFQGTTLEGKDFYFRLRHSWWRVEIDDVLLAEGPPDNGADGVCSWEDAVRYLATKDIILTTHT